MYFDLARELKMPVGQMLATMSSQELTEWVAYFQIIQEEDQYKRMDAENKARLARKPR